MLLVQLGGFEDESVAEKMRALALRMLCDEVLVEQAVHEAVQVFRQSHSVSRALDAGVAFIHKVHVHAPPAPRLPTAKLANLAEWRAFEPAVQVAIGFGLALVLGLVAWGLA